MIPGPDEFKANVKVWVDEAIWGHRFYNDQTPWLVLLEFLAVFRSRNLDGRALDENRAEGGHEFITYHIPRALPLREIVFNNPHIRHIEATVHDNGEKWATWLKQFGGNHEFSYLRERFGEFSRFAHVVEFFQNTAVEPHRQRRWTSRFLFPYGPDCAYADLPGNQATASPDRRFFGRGGELLYLMLSRSGQGPELANAIRSHLLRDTDPWNRVAKALLPKDYRLESNLVESKIGYLPFAERDEYSALAQTWSLLLNLDIPGAALFDPLMRLSALHMLLYMLRRAGEEFGANTEPKFVLEIAAPKKTTLFELSSENFRASRMAALRAVRAHVENAKNEQGWHDALCARVPADAVRSYLADRFSWKPEDAPAGDPDKIFTALRAYAESRHQQHVAKVHNEWTRQIGLLVARRGTGTWYAPSDSLLKALVIGTVEDGREEYHRFLAKLHDRFRLVVAAPEAEEAFGTLPTDQHAFAQNAQRLEQRLRTLGLLRRLSDDCAYVENPFRRRA